VFRELPRKPEPVARGVEEELGRPALLARCRAEAEPAPGRPVARIDRSDGGQPGAVDDRERARARRPAPSHLAPRFGRGWKDRQRSEEDYERRETPSTHESVVGLPEGVRERLRSG
jgi:hypothetical protein